jgi:hypothetical protein
MPERYKIVLRMPEWNNIICGAQATHAWGMEVDGRGNKEGEHHSADNYSEEEEEEPRGADREPPRWQPGEVAVIEEGGTDVQSVLDGEGLKLGVIDWHASWIEDCLEIEPFLKRYSCSPRPSDGGYGGPCKV